MCPLGPIESHVWCWLLLILQSPDGIADDNGQGFDLCPAGGTLFTSSSCSLPAWLALRVISDIQGDNTYH